MTNFSSNPSDVRIGWIGTGIMGAPMAMHLVDAGYTVSVFSRTKKKSEKLISRGCEWYDTPAAMAEKCNVIFTIVGYPKDVEEVYFGDYGVMETLEKDAVVIDMTTTLPGLAVRIHDAAREIGAWAVDAPVSGVRLVP
jgi:3-hydroxyisobutyrate dehydrogenase